MDIPSYLVEAGDLINIRGKSRKGIEKNMEMTEKREIPPWLVLDKAKIAVKVSKIPSQEEIFSLIDEKLVIGFCLK